MYEIDFHADDYAASIESSKRILALMRAGRIDSFSVITNMSCYEECMRLLRESWDQFPGKPLLSLHVNLIDGFWLSRDQGEKMITQSWGQLFLHSFLPGRKRLKEIYAAEISAQLHAFLKQTEGLTDDEGNPISLRIDSHVHTHMTPLVFEALMEALDQMGLQDRVSFIRCSMEPLSLFLTTPGVVGTLSPVNILKNLALHALSHSVRRKLHRANIATGCIFGIAMTGEMDRKRVALMLPKMKEYARRKDAYLEVLSHPGRAAESELAPEYGPDDRKAFLSSGRDVEYQMLMELSRTA